MSTTCSSLHFESGQKVFGFQNKPGFDHFQGLRPVEKVLVQNLVTKM
jgi:hypothetical protein